MTAQSPIPGLSPVSLADGVSSAALPGRFLPELGRGFTVPAIFQPNSEGDTQIPAVNVNGAVRLELPIPPSANRLWRSIGRRVIISPEYAAWKRRAGVELMAARPAQIPGHYALALVLPKKMRGDIDNRVKPVSDLMQAHGVITNDNLCNLIVISRGDVPANRCRITVSAT